MSGKTRRFPSATEDKRATRVSRLARKYGVRYKVICRLGIDKLLAMPEEGRELLISMGGKQIPPFCYIRKLASSDLRAMETLRAGRSTADWLEMFAASDASWIYERAPLRPAPRVKVMKPPKPPPVRVRWVEYGDWSDETGYEVNQMMHLARRSA